MNSNIIWNEGTFLILTVLNPFFIIFGFLSPLFTALYGWILLGEMVSWHFYVSCIVVFIGLYLFYQEELQETVSTIVVKLILIKLVLESW